MKNMLSSKTHSALAKQIDLAIVLMSAQILMICFTWSAPLLASVESIFVKDFPVLNGKLASNLFACELSDEKMVPEALAPMHLIPLNKYNQFDWGRWYSAGLESTLKIQDELIFEPQKPLNVANKSSSPHLCKKLFSTFRYSIFECDHRLRDQTENKVHFDLKKKTLTSGSYRYEFDPKNQMLFRSIEVDDHGLTTLVAKNSDLLLRGDLKKFFALDFDANDIKSVLKHRKNEPLGFFGSLGFFLQIAFFKVSLDLTTDIRFYENSAEIPMVLSFPISPRKHLRSGSGIFYSYELGSSVVLRGLSMPKSKESVSAVKAAHCLNNAVCEFKLDYDVVRGSKTQSRAQMSFLFAEEMISAGAYPIYSTDAVDFLSSLKWPVPSKYRKANRHGIFIDISSLTEGEHRWQFKLKIQP
jgi:hypothetical protein